jgi:hypothetical protein
VEAAEEAVEIDARGGKHGGRCRLLSPGQGEALRQRLRWAGARQAAALRVLGELLTLFCPLRPPLRRRYSASPRSSQIQTTTNASFTHPLIPPPFVCRECHNAPLSACPGHSKLVSLAPIAIGSLKIRTHGQAQPSTELPITAPMSAP